MGQKYFETKEGSLEAVSTKIAQEQPTIKKQEPNVKLERKTYFENKPGSLEDLASKVVSEGLDPVNKVAVKKDFADRKDKDIDNDGDVDSSDKFLHKRRKAISKAVKDESVDKRVSDDAKRMGLTNYRFGRYGRDGKITHTSKDGRLVPVPKKSVSQTSKTPPFSPLKRGGNFLGPKGTSKPREKKPESTPKAIQLSKTIDKQAEKISDVNYNYKDKSKFEKDLSSVMKNIKDMADSDKAPGREFGKETIDTFRGLTPVEDAVRHRRGEVKDNSKEDDVLSDIQFAIGDIHNRPLTSPSKDKNAKKKIDYIIGKIKELKNIKEDLGKEDEKSVKDVIKGLKKAVGLHDKQAASLDKALKNEGNVGVRPDDKGEIINKKKHDAYGGSKGETKPVDPEPKISQVIKGEKETTRANGHMTKKKFSEMRIKLGKNGKTETGQDAPAVETEPKAERI